MENNSNKDELNIRFRFSKDKLKTQVCIVVGLISISFFSMNSYVKGICVAILVVDVLGAIFTSFKIENSEEPEKETMEVSDKPIPKKDKTKSKKKKRGIDHSNEPNPTASINASAQEVQAPTVAPPAPEPKVEVGPPPVKEPEPDTQSQTTEDTEDESTVSDWADFFENIGDE